MIKVNKINWLSKEAKEAEVYLSDGIFSIVGFSHPFNQNVGDVLLMPLYGFGVREIYKLNEDAIVSIEKEVNAFGYKFSGRIIDKEQNQVKIGEFIIQLDVPLPNDIRTGDHVSFVCDRVDIW